ncbi:Solute carrier family 40 member 1 [Acorus calamus]|uniref:Solute carrier family 40 member n=1 Tax=Acorus calamus TaxID=4465 RepID=A0AAV9EX03_ACOCL|nr:Solute carrier family 40 member 1 [Acorus calamus]
MPEIANCIDLNDITSMVDITSTAYDLIDSFMHPNCFKILLFRLDEATKSEYQKGMWEFSVGLFMINVWPDSLLFAAIYGVVESVSTFLFGPTVGKLVDKFTYLQYWLLVSVYNRIPALSESSDRRNARLVSSAPLESQSVIEEYERLSDHEGK